MQTSCNEDYRQCWFVDISTRISEIVLQLRLRCFHSFTKVPTVCFGLLFVKQQTSKFWGFRRKTPNAGVDPKYNSSIGHQKSYRIRPWQQTASEILLCPTPTLDYEFLPAQTPTRFQFQDRAILYQFHWCIYSPPNPESEVLDGFETCNPSCCYSCLIATLAWKITATLTPTSSKRHLQFLTSQA